MAARGNRNNLAPDTGMSSWREVDRDYLPLHHQEVLTMIKWSEAAVEAAARALACRRVHPSKVTEAMVRYQISNAIAALTAAAALKEGK